MNCYVKIIYCNFYLQSSLYKLIVTGIRSLAGQDECNFPKQIIYMFGDKMIKAVYVD